MASTGNRRTQSSRQIWHPDTGIPNVILPTRCVGTQLPLVVLPRRYVAGKDGARGRHTPRVPSTCRPSWCATRGAARSCSAGSASDAPGTAARRSAGGRSSRSSDRNESQECESFAYYGPDFAPIPPAPSLAPRRHPLASGRHASLRRAGMRSLASRDSCRAPSAHTRTHAREVEPPMEWSRRQAATRRRATRSAAVTMLAGLEMSARDPLPYPADRVAIRLSVQL